MTAITGTAAGVRTHPRDMDGQAAAQIRRLDGRDRQQRDHHRDGGGQRELPELQIDSSAARQGEQPGLHALDHAGRAEQAQIIEPIDSAGNHGESRRVRRRAPLGRTPASFRATAFACCASPSTIDATATIPRLSGTHAATKNQAIAGTSSTSPEPQYS